MEHCGQSFCPRRGRPSAPRARQAPRRRALQPPQAQRGLSWRAWRPAPAAAARRRRSGPHAPLLLHEAPPLAGEGRPARAARRGEARGEAAAATGDASGQPQRGPWPLAEGAPAATSHEGSCPGHCARPVVKEKKKLCNWSASRAACCGTAQQALPGQPPLHDPVPHPTPPPSSFRCLTAFPGGAGGVEGRVFFGLHILMLISTTARARVALPTRGVARALEARGGLCTCAAVPRGARVSPAWRQQGATL